jgi:ubiquinone/menaquinone biosynthesis C-methylase UbiE
MIRNAKAHDPRNTLRIRYVRTDANRLTGIADSSFDVALANMSLMDIEDGEGAIREVGRVLREGGVFVASISHPCFDNGSNSDWVAVKSTLSKPRVYRRIRTYRNPFSEKIPWRVGETERKFTWSFHRPLKWYAKALRSNGMTIAALEEPEPTKEFLLAEDYMTGLGFLEVPLHLVIQAVKN